MKFVELNSVTRTLLLRSVGTIGEYIRYDERGQLLAMRTARCCCLVVYSLILPVSQRCTLLIGGFG